MRARAVCYAAIPASRAEGRVRGPAPTGRAASHAAIPAPRGGARLRAPRRRGAPIGVLIGAILAWSLGAEAMETPAPPGEGMAPAFAAEARSKIATVLAAEEFGHTEKTTRLRARKPDPDEKQADWLAGLRGFFRRVAKILAGIGEVLLWVGAALTVFAIVYYRERWLPYLGLSRRVPATPPVGRVAQLTLAGRPLPDDIPSAALALWRTDRHAEALSLLYRGALARAHERFDLSLPPGVTEGEALRAIAHAAPAVRAYFAALTAAWMALAYARRTPEAIAREIEPLAEGFRRHLEET
ncbi:MAG: hypothetical protein ACREXU_00780 [Gammaproteobacteria bacterium]